MIWKILASYDRMHRIDTNGDRNSRRQQLTQVYVVKKIDVCVCIINQAMYIIKNTGCR